MAKKSVVKTNQNEVYDGSSIKELEFPENVQQRMGMYISSSDQVGYMVIIREILNNSVDEFLAGHCNHILFHRKSEHSYQIKDNGRGVPFDVVDGINSLSRIYLKLHSSRNFVEKSVYSTGLNGVGSSLTNALSSKFEVTSTRKLNRGYIRCEGGYQKEVKVSTIKTLPKDPFRSSSTDVEFTIDTKWFDNDMVIDPKEIHKLARDAAYLNNELTIHFIDDVEGINETYLFKNGIQVLLDTEVCTNSILKKSVNLGIDVVKDTKVEIAFTYDDSFTSENIISFCNTINTSEGGAHVTGFKRSFSQKILAYVNDKKLCKEKVSNEDVYIGLNAVVSVFVFNPKYTSQTKQQLKNTEVMGHVVTFTNSAIDEWLNKNPSEIKVIAAKLDLIAKSRIAQKRALENVKKDSNSNLLQSLSAPTKFEDCRSNDPTKTELLLVEG